MFIITYRIDELVLDLTQAEVRSELAKEETQRLTTGGIVLHETSTSLFLVNGLEIEDLQYVPPVFSVY